MCQTLSVLQTSFDLIIITIHELNIITLILHMDNPRLRRIR